jgi:DHA2 family multidrug resistance protein-like MFS transporter
MQPGMSERRRWLAIVALCCGNSVASFDSTILNVALPTIAHDLHVPLSSAPLVVSTYQLVLLMTALPFAALGEKVGLTRLYQLGQALFAIASLGSVLAPNLPLLVVSRAVQALGAAAIMSISPALVRAVYPPEKLARGLALNAFVVTVAAMVAPALGGAVLAFAGWRWIFLLVLPLVLGSLVFGRTLPRSPTHDKPYDFRAAGMSAAMFLLTIGGVQMAVHGVPLAIWAASVAAGVLVGIRFVRRERQSPRPVLPVDLLGRPVMALALAGGFCVYAASQSVTLGLPFRLQHVYGLSPPEVGAVLATWPLALMMTVPLSGYFSNRAPPGLLEGVGMIFCVVGMVALSFLPPHPTFFQFAWRLWLGGAGIGMFLSPNNRLILGAAPAERVAAASGLIATMRMTGQTLGATLAALLLALGAGLGRTPTLVAAAMMAVALASSLARVRFGRRGT